MILHSKIEEDTRQLWEMPFDVSISTVVATSKVKNRHTERRVAVFLFV